MTILVPPGNPPTLPESRGVGGGQTLYVPASYFGHSSAAGGPEWGTRLGSPVPLKSS